VSGRIIVGDALAQLREMPDESVNCVITSPPYWGLRNYGVAGQLGLEETPGKYIDAMVGVFREVRRVLRSDGTLWLNLGDSYSNIGKWGGRTSGKHTKDLHGGHQTSSMVHGGKIDGLKPKDLVGIPWRVAFALQSDGWYLRSDIIWHKPNPMPESVTDRPTKSHEYVFLFTKREHYWYDAKAIREPEKPESAARYDYSFGGAKAEQIAEKDALGMALRTRPIGERTGDGMRNKRTVWTIATHSTPEAHFATFPDDLVTPCVLAGCPAGGVVLDPFGGTGTVARVAEDIGRRWILIELNPEYAAMADRRMRQQGLLTSTGAA